jgi:hypothetical protein
VSQKKKFWPTDLHELSRIRSKESQPADRRQPDFIAAGEGEKTRIFTAKGAKASHMLCLLLPYHSSLITDHFFNSLITSSLV